MRGAVNLLVVVITVTASALVIYGHGLRTVTVTSHADVAADTSIGMAVGTCPILAAGLAAMAAVSALVVIAASATLAVAILLQIRASLATAVQRGGGWQRHDRVGMGWWGNFMATARQHALGFP